jgi:hypothetical protein
MNPLTRVNWMLAVLALGLAILLWRLQPEPAVPITNLQPDQVTLIQVQRAGGTRLELMRQDGQWQMVEPQRGPVAAEAAARLAAISELPSLGRIDGPERPEFGLQPPHYLLQLNRIAVRVGGYDPYSGLRYLAVDGEIHLVHEGFVTRLEIEPTELLEP